MKPLVSILLISAMLGCTASSAPPQQSLNPAIGAPAKDKYKDIRHGEDWLNPYLHVCSHGVDVSLRALKRKTETVPIGDLRRALLDVSVEGWPYGRVVALQSCSIGTPGDRQAQAERMMKVENVLTSMGLSINGWPS
jgi:hypothetical protein